MGNFIQPDETITKDYDPKLIRRLLGYIRPYRSKFVIALFMMLLSSLTFVSGPYLFKIALDEGIASGSRQVLLSVSIVYLVATLTQWALIFLRVNLMAQVGQSIIYDLRSELFLHLQALSLSFFNRFSVGRVISRVINDVGVIRQFITWAIIGSARDVFVLCGIIIAMLSMHVRLSLLTFAVLPVMVLVANKFRLAGRETYRQVRSAVSWVNSVLAENINAVRVVQAFSREDHNYNHFKEQVNRNNLVLNLKAARIASGFAPSMDLLGMISTALVVWIGGVYVLDEVISSGVLIAFILYIGRFFDPIRSLSMRFDQFQSTMAGSERIFALLDISPEVQDVPNAHVFETMDGEVEFKNVSFHYTDDTVPVLSGINIKVKPANTIALVGKTGAGKSTFVKLLSRFWDPTEGSILIDGHDLKHSQQKSIRSQMGVVLQEPFLFNGTIHENIKFGCLTASDADIKSAAATVGAHQFITKLWNGYDTPVEEGGVVLSVGQRQLISFARALLSDPRILILDEATSSVDPQTEQIIQKALEILLRDRTAFVIAHRLSTVVMADRIIVLDEGRIVEQGNHTELLKSSGLYANMYKMGLKN